MTHIIGQDGQPFSSERSIKTRGQVELAGYVSYHLFHKFSGKTIAKVGPYRNLLLNQGLDRWGSSSSYVVDGIKLGAGNSTPAETQTGLDSYLGVTNVTGATDNNATQDSNLDWYRYARMTYQAEAGIGTGNIAELGLSYNRFTADGTQIMSRELVRDGAGDPTIIQKDSDEILDLTWELRAYQNTTDVVLPGQIINGVSTEVTVRPAQINVFGRHAVNYAMGPFPRSTQIQLEWSAFNGVIQDILNVPSGTVFSNTSLAWGTYQLGTYQLALSQFFDTSVVANIGAVMYSTNVGDWQIGFNPAINKTDTQQINFNHLLSWSRKTDIP